MRYTRTCSSLIVVVFGIAVTGLHYYVYVTHQIHTSHALLDVQNDT